MREEEEEEGWDGMGAVVPASLPGRLKLYICILWLARI